MKLPKYLTFALIVIFFITIFLLAIPGLWDFDIWFHVKSGEIIATQGIIHHDVFSYVTEGREWFPYEWLFQVTVYYFKSIFGFEPLKYFAAGMGTLSVFIIYLFARRIFGLNVILSLASSFFFFVSVHEFITPRPHIVAYTFLLINLYLILQYYFKKVNLLFLSLPVTLAWANLHGSIFLSVALFGGFATMSFLNFILQKDRSWLKQFKTLSIYTGITAILTVLPPLGLIQYRLLIKFFEQREIITQFIDEWTPLSVNPIGFMIYSTTLILLILTFISINIRQKTYKQMLWVLPLLPFTLAVYTAVRNAFLGYITLTLILIWCFTKLKFSSYSKLKQTILLILLGLFLVSHIFLLQFKKQDEVVRLLYYPDKATQFILDYKLKGNMFNEYGHGGYLLYHLYPAQKVFFDGRTDLYLCCELPYTTNLAVKKHLPDGEYKKVLDELWNKYDISFALMRTEKHVILRKISRLLETDPTWSLVYWDDWSQIFVRHDGKNEELINKIGAKAATPYNKDPFQKGSEEQALEEYQKMIKIADSAKSRNAVGFILLQQKKYPEAKQEFEKAIEIYPGLESPYMNLAELALADGDLDQAISLYRKAKELAPDRGLIYIRLGQILEQDNNPEALNVWREGFEKTVDTEAKEKLKELLSN